MMIPESFNGVLSLGYDTDGDGTDDSYSVFVIRQIQETPLLDMYLRMAPCPGLPTTSRTLPLPGGWRTAPPCL
ncbi:MAG: hypothetical protein ACLSHU_02805 [Oscillospiraceae bacterium]